MERLLTVVFNFPGAALVLLVVGFALGWFARALRQQFLKGPSENSSQ